MAAFLVPPPPFTPAPGGLLDVATLRDEADPHWQAGVEWEALCAPPAATVAVDCEDDDPAWTAEPTGFPAATGWTPFHLYHRHRCSPAGRTLDEADALAADALARGEGRAIEAVVERGGPTPDGSLGPITPTLASEATVLGSGALSIVDAVAALEQAVGWTYGGVGVIHLSRALATLAAEKGLVTSTGGRFRTALGTPVAVGAGYFGSDASGLSAGSSTAYATGPVVVYRSPILNLGSAREQFDRATNTVEVLVARTVLVGWECEAFAAEVDHDVPVPPEPVS